MNFNYQLGYRAKKTAIAVFFCILACSLLDRESALNASIATVICLQQTHEKTLEMGVHRMIGTIIGGLIGFCFIQIGGSIAGFYNFAYIIVIPFILLIGIYVCNIVNLKASTSICCIVLLNICLNFHGSVQDSLLYVTNRVVETFIGIIIAVLVNRFFFRKSDILTNE